MMSIGRSSRRENLLQVRGVEPMFVIRTRLANHIRASSRENGCTKQTRHMTAPDRNRQHVNSALDAKEFSSQISNGSPNRSLGLSNSDLSRLGLRLLLTG